MPDLPYRFEPLPGYDAYKVTAILKDYLGMLMEQPENREYIDQILVQINNYIIQLRNLRADRPVDTIKASYKAVDDLFSAAPEENKKEIQCKAGCTACCFIEIDVSGDEVSAILDYCRENSIDIDREYLSKQATAGRKSYSSFSRCVFLKDDLCSVYPVRPIACRKHFVMTDPALCDFSKNIVNRVGGYFDINTEILASAVLNVAESGLFEKILIGELDKSNK
jgi:Fe-S-cluster containining protein